MTIERWAGCYDQGWRDLITPESFSHPAKMSRGLLVRIFDELVRLGALQKGDIVLDPFGGIATTAIEGASRGMQVVCVELEEKFVAMARQNVEGHARGWETLGFPIPIIVQGDSRALREVLRHSVFADRYPDAFVSSPPYASSDQNYAEGRTRVDWDKGARAGMKNDRISGPDAAYGHSEGQLADLQEGAIEAVIASPPYAGIASGAGGLNTTPAVEGQQGGRSPESPSQQADQRYGDAEGQLAKMTEGSIDTVVGSPPFLDARSYLSDKGSIKGSTTPTAHDPEAMGTSDGNLQAMRAGDVDAVVGSPPYSTGCIREGSGVDDEAGRIEGSASSLVVPRPGIRTGSVDAVVSSPPFTQGYSGGGGINVKGYGKDGADKVGSRTYQGTGAERSKGNLETLALGDVDAVVGSPPWGDGPDGSEGGVKGSKFNKAEDILRAGRGKGASDEARLRQAARDEQRTYPADTPGQLANLPMLRHKFDCPAREPVPGEWRGNFGDYRCTCGLAATVANCKHQFQDTTFCLHCGWEPTADDIQAIEDAARRGELRGVRDLQQRADDVSAVRAADTGAHGTLLPAAVVGSPPYENIERANHVPGESVRRAREGRADQAVSYGRTAGNLGNVEGETFWSAAAQIVREAYAILKPGGVAVWVTKAFVRDKRVVDFPGDWRKLCEHVGFETVQEVHAMLVAEERRSDLFDGETVKRRERKSFFRRLAEKRGSPRIDFEVVYFMIKR